MQGHFNSKDYMDSDRYPKAELKVYSAHDKDYNPANNYWASYTYFKKIDADCKVIEIPLGIAYRVLNAKKTNVYVSAGSSSIIMRRESYEYYYKNQAGSRTA